MYFFTILPTREREKKIKNCLTKYMIYTKLLNLDKLLLLFLPLTA